MRLSELMAESGLAFWPQAAMVVFLAAFAAVVVRAWWVTPRREHEAAGRIPLEEAGPAGAPGAGVEVADGE